MRAGGAGVHDLDLPALTLRVFRVHTGQLGREQRRLVTARAGANLDEHVLVVVLVARQEQPLELVFERRLSRLQLVDLGLGQLLQLGIAALAENVPGLALAPEDVAVLAEARYDLQRLRVLLAQPGVLRRLSEDGRIGQRPGQLVGPFLDLSQLVEQHPASAPPRANAFHSSQANGVHHSPLGRIRFTIRPGESASSIRRTRTMLIAS